MRQNAVVCGNGLMNKGLPLTLSQTTKLKNNPNSKLLQIAE